MPQDEPGVDIEEVYRVVGALMAAATRLEWTLMDAVTALTRSPLTSLVVRGQRGTSLVRAAKRLLVGGVGSTLEDEAGGRTDRLGLMSAHDTQSYLDALGRAERLLDQRDEVAHSLWLANAVPGGVMSQRRRTAGVDERTWTLIELEQLRQDLANVECDIFICNWNTDGSHSQRLDPREGDVTG